VHALTVLLAGRALLRWTGSVNGAVLGAAYFGLHPARAESVAWISGRPDSLAALGLLVCLEGVDKLRASPRAVGMACFFLGMVIAFGAKETSLLVPLLVAVELVAPAGRLPSWRDLRRIWTLYASVAVVALYLIARKLLLPIRPFAIQGLAPITHLGFVF